VLGRQAAAAFSLATAPGGARLTRTGRDPQRSPVSGLLSGGDAELSDAIAIARALGGVEPLPAGALEHVDLDRDGRVSVADLLNVLRLALGRAPAPLAVPRVVDVFPALARPGDLIRLEGEQLAGAELSVLVIRGADVRSRPPATTGASSLEFTLPVFDTPGLITVRVLRSGVLSNAVTLDVLLGPIVLEVAPPAVAPGGMLELRGKGFGADPAAVQVRLGASSLGLSTLEIEAPFGRTTAVAADGTFTVAAPNARPLELELLLPGGETTLAAIYRGDPAVLDADSTALFWTFGVCGGPALRGDIASTLLDRLVAHPAVLALGARIRTGHSAHPALVELLALPDVAAALRLALSEATAALHALRS
jgi:hypothetical protein